VRLDLRIAILLLTSFLTLPACKVPDKGPCLTPDFRLRVLDPDGTPVKLILVDQHPPGVWDVISNCDDVCPEGDAFRIFPGPHIDRKLPLCVGVRGLGAVSISIPPFEVEEVTVRFEQPGTLDVIATGMHGAPGRYLITVAATGDGPSDCYFEGTLDPEDGLAEFPLQPGEYAVEICQPSLRYDPIFATRVTVKPGLNLLPIDLPPSYDIAIRLPGERDEEWIAAFTPDGAPLFEDREEAGLFEYVGLPPGAYSFVLHGDEQEDAMTVQVPAERVVLFQPSRIDGMRVRVIFDHESLVQAGMRDGDLVIAMAGTEFCSWRMALSLVDIAAVLPEVEITILRNDQRLLRKVPGKLLRDAVDQNRLTPVRR